MFNYKSRKQLSIFDFKTDFESKLDPNNRWVKLANLLDWDKFAAVYAQSLSSTTDASSIGQNHHGSLDNQAYRSKRRSWND